MRRPFVICLCAWLALAGAAGAESTQVRVNTTPPDALLFVDGVSRDRSPTTLTGLAPGTHLLVAQRHGYREARQSFSLLAGQKLALELTLEELRGLVLVHSSPTGAEVHVDQGFRGRTPLLLSDFPLGKHRVRISLQGYISRELDVEVNDRVPQKLQADLVADSATIRFTSEPAGAEVFINGAARGRTPVQVERVPSGALEVALRLAGHAEYTEKLMLKAGESVAVDARLQARPGSLTVLTQPDKARVYVDDQFRGEAPVSLADLAPGEHRVRVELKGHEADARSVTVKADASTTEEFRLASNSGVLILVTEPPGVKVLVDGTELGETAAAEAGLVSQALTVEYLSRGEHTLQLTRPGYSFRPRRFTVETGQAVTLHEKLTRLFIPDFLVRTGAGEGGTRTGILLREYPNGDLELEVRPGVIDRIKGTDVLEKRPIRAGAPP